MKKRSKLYITNLLMILVLLLTGCSKSADPTPNNSGKGIGTGSGTLGTATVTPPSTQFISSQDYTASGIGAYWTQQFTVNTATAFVFRFASQYQAQAAIITPNQLSNFQSNKSFTGYSLFDRTFGTNFITLQAGTYYVVIRNETTGSNQWSTELDYAITLPASDKAKFLDYYVTGTKSFANAGKFWQPFTIQAGYRYFIDGCNVNCDIKIIPSSQLLPFQNNQTFNYYSTYYDGTGASPGLWELSLQPGDYFMISSNSTVASLTYILERWKVN